MPKIGFYDYDTASVGTDGVILKNSLTSLAGLSAGMTEVGAGTNVFSSLGVKTDDLGNSGIEITGITDQADLAIEGTLRVLITNTDGPFDADHTTSTGSAENFMSLQGGTNFFLNYDNGGNYTKLFCSATLNHRYPGTADQWFRGDPQNRKSENGDLVELILTWDQTGIQLYLDKYKIFDCPWSDTATRPAASTIRLGGPANGGNYTYRNLLISKKKMILPQASHKVRCIHFYGDSYTKLSQYSRPDASSRANMFRLGTSSVAGAEILTPDGYNGTTYWDGPDPGQDSSPYHTIHRVLARKGLFTSNIRFWGEGGAGYVQAAGTDSGTNVETRVTTVALSGAYEIPDIAVMIAGYNDATNGQTKADIQTAVGNIITALKAANSDIKVIITTAPYNTNVAYSPTLAELQAVNNGITDAVSGDSAVTLIDIYTIFGGSTNDGSTNMSGDYVHPDQNGFAIYARHISQAIANLF